MRLSLVAEPATVTASDLETRTLSGVALPYGVQGSTSAGLVSVVAGAVEIPTDLRRVKLFTEHGRQTPVGYATAADDTPDALLMSFRVAATPAGDDALLEASEGVRDALSVELDDVVIRAGRVVSARLVAVATTSIPAYADARLVASDTPPEDDTPAPPAAPSEDDDTEEEEDDAMTTTAPDPTEARASLPTAGALTAARPGPPPGGLVRELAAAFTAVDQGRASREQLFAALSDIKWSDGGGVTGTPPQVLGELWNGVTYQRKWVGQTSYTTDLNSMTVGGFVWDPKPAVGPYAGDKAAVPSNLAKMVWTEFPAQRFAGAHDIDRIYRDFNIPGFWEAYWAAMTESYAMQSDAAVLDAILAGGTPDATQTNVWGALVSGILAVAPYAGASQVKVAIAGNLLGDLAGLTEAATPALFSSVFSSFEDLVNATGPGVPDDTVAVWAQPAVTTKEAGSVPIRAEALNIPNGGIDAGLFGYICPFVTRADAVRVYTITAAPPAADAAATRKR